MKDSIDYARFNFLQGDWESQDRDDQFQIRITWDPYNKEFVGKMTKLGGKTSAAAGFHLLDTAWRGEPKNDDSFEEWSQARDGPHKDPFWIVRTIDLNRTSNNRFFGESDGARGLAARS